MDMKDYNDLLPAKFLIVMRKSYSAIFELAEKNIKDLGLNSTEFLILYSISSNGTLTIQDIATRIHMTSGNMTYTIDKLEKKQLIKRVKDVSDQRKIFIDFTADGLLFWTKVIENHLNYLTNIFGDIDPKILLETIENMKYIGKTLEEIK